MGEYALYGSERIKIGTCEDMYYLRADQRGRVRPLSGNVDPMSPRDLEYLRFRFPFPDEDGLEPGAFERCDRAVGLYGLEVPVDVEHHTVQFTASAGYVVSLPCPESAEGKASGLTFHRNGHPGPVQFGQQGLRGGLWVLIGQCGGCHAAYRYPTVVDVAPVLEAVLKEAERKSQDGSQRRWWATVGERIAAGYHVPAESEARPRARE